ncbi:MAG: bifunctional DNA-formamidopyrimidine glycosylase/DNA-(apurinic or apyrimidinic site) lyase [Anaerolineales bacterium]|nr:bifunctional DNA-formamidopyrimidine glycosylase/DNA-(apurinic or apyrimidinic site) lyase [Anaerolineales bacterium]
MPELPEVETIVRALRPALVGKSILSADLRWPRSLAAPTPLAFARRVKGQKIEEVSRRAKYFILHLSSFSLLIHLRMSGDLLVKEGAYIPAKHDRLHLRLSDDTTLVFSDPRKFGRLWLTADPEEVLGDLGPEPLDPSFTPQIFYERLHIRRRQLKPLLLDQTFIAGLGNIYTDEALHMARLHPLAQSDSVTAEQVEALWRAVREVLEEGIRSNGTSIDWVYRGGEFQNQLRVYGRAGQPCPVCATKIERLVIGQRGAHFCPACQPFKE